MYAYANERTNGVAAFPPPGSGRYMRMTRFATTEEAERKAPRKKRAERAFPPGNPTCSGTGTKCKMWSIPGTFFVINERPKVDRAIF